ncbi:MAG: MFS transporter [Pseudomonadota bacterium]|nr:MFS transporter [Pseudomonadota bacterium]
MGNENMIPTPPIAQPEAVEKKAQASSWWTLTVLTLISSCHFLDRTVVSIVVEPIREEFGLSDQQIGLLTGLAYGLMFALACLPLGTLVDRVNRRNLLAGVVLVWSGFTALAGFANSFVHLVLARMGVGAAEAGGSPNSMSIISDLFPPKQRSTAIGIFFTSTAIGGAMSALIGTHVAAVHGWRAAFMIAGVPGFLFAMLLLFTVKEPKRGGMDPVTVSTGPTPKVGETLRFLISQRAMIHLFIGMSLAIGALSANGAWLVAFLMRIHNLDIKQAAVITGITFGAFSSLGSLLGGLISDRLSRNAGHRRAGFSAAASLIAVPLILGATLTQNSTAATVLFFGVAAAIFATIPPAFASVVGLAKPRMRGITLASIQVVTNLIGYGVAPFLVGVLSDGFGGPQSLRYALVTLLSVAMGWAMIHFFLASRSYNRDALRAVES